jgi:hypothetical protein
MLYKHSGHPINLRDVVHNIHKHIHNKFVS